MSKNILIITISLIALILIGAGVYLVINKSSIQKQENQGIEKEEVAPIANLPQAPNKPEEPKEPTPQPKEPTTTESIDTSNWKTYRNEKYGFEIKYPREFVIREGNEAKYPSGALFPPSFLIGPPIVRISFPESEYQEATYGMPP